MLSYYRRGRLAGVSALSFAKKYTAFLAAVLAYTFAPIRIMSLVGCVFAFLGFVYAACILVDFVLFGNPVKGWAPLMIMMLVMGGCQMLMLGIIGEYLWRTSTQVRHRDYYIVDAFYGSNSTGSSSEEAQEQSRTAAH
jgi:dolichol-phosphate mannosyltransferase